MKTENRTVLILLVLMLLSVSACNNSVEQASEHRAHKPRFSIPTDIEIRENTKDIITVSATDPDGTTDVTVSISGGDDQEKFRLNNRQLSFVSVADYEQPLDRNTDNIYEVELTAVDGTKLSTTRIFKINVINTNDNEPYFLTNDGINIDENISEAVTLAVFDADNDEITYSISGGVDADIFQLLGEKNDTLAFKSLPDFENPQNFNQSSPNIYQVEVTAKDNIESQNSIRKLFQIQVKDVQVQPPQVQTNGSIKEILFSWSSDLEATHFRLFQDPDGVSGFNQVGANLPSTTQQISLAVVAHLQDWENSAYLVSACNGAFCETSSTINVNNHILDSIAYIKSPDPAANSQFGSAMAFSGDGNTLAVGARLDNKFVGSVFIYDTADVVPMDTPQEITPSDTDVNPGSSFGVALAFSEDGNTLAVGANGAAGTVFIFKRDITTNSWQQQAIIRASNAGTNNSDQFGGALDLSGDASTLVIGAKNEDSTSKIISTDGTGEDDNSGQDVGAVYVFSQTPTGWDQVAYIKPSGTAQGFGISLDLNADGNTLAVGAPGSNTGAVYLYERNLQQWSELALINSGNGELNDNFGYAVALSDDMETLVVSATGEDSNAEYSLGGIGESDNSASNAGAVYVYSRSTNWSQQAYLESPNTDINDKYGASISINSDGTLLAIGANYENSAATGLGSNLNLVNDCQSTKTNCKLDSGAVYVFSRLNTAITTRWKYPKYIKAANTGIYDWFGRTVKFSLDGNSLAVGAINEDSNEKGVISGSNIQENEAAVNSGAVYLF